MKYKKTTMEDIAKKLNISKVSVYKALTGKQDISEDLRQKVLDCAISMNYKLIDPLTKLCRNFHFITPKRFSTSTEQFYNGIFLSLAKLLNNIDITLENHIADDLFDVRKFISERKFHHEYFGVFWAGIIPPKILDAFLDANIPIICIDNYLQKSNGSFIYIDDYNAGFNITEYLIEHGHKDICFVIETDVSSNVDKLYGFKKALHMHNISFKPEMHIEISLSKMENFIDFKLPNPLPTAFLFDSDHSAQNFMISTINQGYKIPEDFSVASFDNTRLCDETVPKLTSIGPNRDEVVRACYRTMLKRLSTSTLRPYFTIVSSNLTVRDSVKKITP